MTKTTAIVAAMAAVSQDVDPRVRMKEVRAEIKMFVEGGGNPWGINHVGEIYSDPNDMRRAMIALHDMLDVKTQKHNKASAHVASLLSDLEDQDQQTLNLLAQVTSDNTIINFLDKAGEELRVHYDEQVKQNEKLKEDLMIQAKKLEAALLTLHTVMEG